MSNDVIDQAFAFVREKFENKSYDFWRDQIGDQIESDPLYLPHPSHDGTDIEITVCWAKETGGPICVLVSTTDHISWSMPTKSFQVSDQEERP